MTVILKNNAFGFLAASISASDTSLLLTTGTGGNFPSLNVNEYFYATIAPTSGATEVVKVIARASDTFTVVRGQEGTTPLPFAAGSRVELRVTAQSVIDAIDDRVAQHDQAAEITIVDAGGYYSSGNVEGALQEAAQFTQSGTGAVLRTQTVKLREVVSVADFKQTGVTDATALANAVAAANGRPLLIPSTLDVASPVTITCPIVDSVERLFTDASQVTISNKLPVRPEWFGSTAGNLIRAINSLPTEGGSIVLRNADYNIVGYYVIDVGASLWQGNEKKNLKIYGSGMPRLATDGSRFISGSGSVIQGMMLNFADGFECYDLGVDAGSHVVNTYAPGTPMEGFIPCTHKFQGTPGNLATYVKDVAFGNIKALCTNNLNHAVLIEFGNGVQHGYVEAIGGFHGYVVKATNVRGGDVWAYGQSADSYIIKSDQYTNCANVAINSLSIGRRDWARSAAGYWQSTAGGYITNNIHIGKLVAINCTNPFIRVGDNEFITDVTVDSISIDDVTGVGINISGKWRRVTLGSSIISNTSSNSVVVFDSGGMESINIGNVQVTNSGGSAYVLDYAELQHGDLMAVNCTNYGFQRAGATPFDINRFRGFQFGLGAGTSLKELLTGANLVNGWANNGGGTWPFQLVRIGYNNYLKGHIYGGSAATIATIPAASTAGWEQNRPAFTMTFLCPAVDSTGTRTFAHIDINADGTIVVANYAALGGAAVQSIALDGIVYIN